MFVVSFPSIPVFILLMIVSKLFGKSKNNNAISDELLSKLISFGFGAIIGDVLFHMMPILFENRIIFKC